MEIDYELFGGVEVRGCIEWEHEDGTSSIESNVEPGSEQFYTVYLLKRESGEWHAVADAKDQYTADLVAGIIKDGMTMSAALHEINRLSSANQ